jgi:5'-deoxynucleotidase YfbR-like HD superfamily hydrolase
VSAERRIPLADLADLDLLIAFLMEIDALKRSDRRSYITGGSRRENTAEHSWHVVIAAWTLAGRASVTLSMEKVLKLAAVHDLCELDHGDTFIHTADTVEQRRLEQQCVSRLMRRYGAVFGELESLWLEYEAASTIEARFVRAVDRLLPFLHNLANEGRTWREHDISSAQVLRLYVPLESDFPELVAWVRAKVAEAVAEGWLRGA